MKALRRVAAFVSTLLVALVVVQTLDLVACADEAAVNDRPDGYHVHGTPTAGGHPAPSPGTHDGDVPHDEAPGIADCLCHVVFTSTDQLPEVASSPAVQGAAYAPFLASAGAVHARPLDHVPLV